MQKLILLAALAAAGSVVAGESSGNDVLVTRGGVSVTLQDVDTFVARIPKEQRAMFINSPTRITEMLNKMLLTKQLAAQARAEHLDLQPAVATEMRASDDEILARARMEDFTKNINIPDLNKLVAEQYATHKELYRVPASVDVRQILIATNDKRTEDDAKTLAEKVRAEAVAQPKSFEALVEKYSDDASKADHGLIKDATSNKYVQEFRDAATVLAKVGDVSPVIHSSYGYHILQLTTKHPERQQTLDEVRDQLTLAMRDQYVANQRRDLVNELNNQKLDINSATVDTLRDRYDEQGNVRTASSRPSGNASPASPPASH